MGPPSPSLPDRSIPSLSGATDDTIVDGASASMVREPMLGRGDSVGRYLLVDPLGRGAMGMVFRAYDPDLDRQVAIKILLEHGGPDARDRLLREAKAMARIHHPNVVTVHDAGVHERAVFIAMEVVDGPSLDRWLDTGPRSRAEILDALAGAARGLAAAHAAGVIHRDFKPANVLVTADGRAKVGDFGLAGIEDPVTGPAAEDSHVIGTPAYMSPEQFAGVGVDARSDQFAFAITLHEALYGARPFIATTWPELVAKVTQGTISPELAARRGRIDAIIRRALAVDPVQRFESMDALLAALERARRPVWRPWAIGAAGVTVALGLGLAAWPREPTETCTPGARRVETVWSRGARDALRIGGSDYTEAFARQARERFVKGLDDYAAAWSTAHDESCAAVGPRADAGTPMQRHIAECLESRLDSLQGLAELAATEPLSAGRVGDLLRALPPIEACTSGSWVPYPSDPEAAAQAAALHRTLARIELAHLQGHQALALEQARAAVEEARALGDRYLLALALIRHAVVLEEDVQAFALFDEAIELALAGGFDLLAVQAIHEVLRWSWPHDEVHGWRELGLLASVARGLVERTTNNPSVLGNLAISEGVVLRRAGQLDEAADCDRRAEEHFVRAGDPEGIAKARINQAVTDLRQGRTQAITRLEAAVHDLEREVGDASDLYFQGQHVLVGALTSAGRMRDAYEVATAAYASACEHYAPNASTFRRVLLSYAGAAVNVGELEVARGAFARRSEISTLTRAEIRALDVLELELLIGEGRSDRVPARAAELRRGLEPDDQVTRGWFELYTTLALFLQGRHAEVRERVLDHQVPDASHREREAIQSIVVLVAMLSRAPPPPEGWRARFPPPPYQMTLTDRVRTLVEALDGEPDPTATVRRVRDEMAAAYHPGESTVRLLDAWLAAPEAR